MPWGLFQKYVDMLLWGVKFLSTIGLTDKNLRDEIKQQLNKWDFFSSSSSSNMIEHDWTKLENGLSQEHAERLPFNTSSARFHPICYNLITYMYFSFAQTQKIPYVSALVNINHIGCPLPAFFSAAKETAWFKVGLVYVLVDGFKQFMFYIFWTIFGMMIHIDSPFFLGGDGLKHYQPVGHQKKTAVDDDRCPH